MEGGPNVGSPQLSAMVRQDDGVGILGNNQLDFKHATIIVNVSLHFEKRLAHALHLDHFYSGWNEAATQDW
jgi:hypothetical protein